MVRNKSAMLKINGQWPKMPCYFTLLAVYLKCSDASSAAVLEHFTDLIQNLASGEKISILTDVQPPEGCAISTVSARCEVHMMLKVNWSDHVDVKVL